MKNVKNVVENKNGQVLDSDVTLAKQNTGMSWKEKLSQIKKRR